MCDDTYDVIQSQLISLYMASGATIDKLPLDFQCILVIKRISYWSGFTWGFLLWLFSTERGTITHNGEIFNARQFYTTSTQQYAPCTNCRLCHAANKVFTHYLLCNCSWATVMKFSKLNTIYHFLNVSFHTHLLTMTSVFCLTISVNASRFIFVLVPAVSQGLSPHKNTCSISWFSSGSVSSSTK